MKVAFDVSTLNKPYLSGMGVWMVQLFQAMGVEQRSSSDFVIQPVCRISRAKHRSLMQKHLETKVKVYVPWLSDRKYHLFHGPDFRLPNSVGIPRVVSIPDIAFYETGMTSPDFAKKKTQEVEHLLERLCPEAVITISEYTKSELLKRFPAYESKIYVTPMGHEHLLTDGQISILSPEDRPYLLFVGNLEARKNVVRILQAFDQLCENNKNFDEQLVMIGRPGFGYNSIEGVLDCMKNKRRVKLLGYVENRQLIAYYRHARAFVYPSLIEGFGIPLLEAMVNNCPIITSNVTATAEVTQDVALQVSPEDVNEIEHAMKTLLEDASMASQLAEKGRRRVEEYSWKRCALETLAVYKKQIP